MIQSLGIIKDSNGVTEYANPLINVYMNSNSKFVPTIGVAQVGKIVTQGENESFNAVAQIGTYEYTLENPSFLEVQQAVLTGLEADYPQVTFTIIE
jgi:hypothetical protein